MLTLILVRLFFMFLWCFVVSWLTAPNSRSAGVRVGTYLSDIVPKIHSFLSSNHSASSDEVSESLVELWETCLRALESLILRCPNKINPYVDQMVLLAKSKSLYDPMYSYEDEVDHKQTAATKKATKAEDDWGKNIS